MSKHIKRRSNKVVTSILMILVFGLITVSGLLLLNRFKDKLPTDMQISLPQINLADLIDKSKKVLSSRSSDLIPIASELVLKIGVISDSHGANLLMEKAVAEMKITKVNVILHLGDFSAGGEDVSFSDAKNILAASDIAYHVLPGDHDFNWFPTHSRENFENAFRKSYDQYFEINRVEIIMLENSINVDDKTNQIEWLKGVLSETGTTSIRLFFSARPLYSPYFAYKEDLQGTDIINLLIDSGIKYAFAGDTHLYAQYQDLSEKLNMITVGAIGEYKNPLPQWVSVEVYSDGTTKTTSHPIIDF